MSGKQPTTILTCPVANIKGVTLRAREEAMGVGRGKAAGGTGTVTQSEPGDSSIRDLQQNCLEVLDELLAGTFVTVL